MRYILILIIGLTFSYRAIGQNSENKVTPFLKTGVGYFNDELMIDGSVLWSEVGIKLSNRYFFSIQANLAETINDKGNYTDLGGMEFEFIHTYKIVTLFMGYELMSKNKMHSFIPMFGPFYSVNKFNYPEYDETNFYGIPNISTSNIGINLAIQYLYNFKNGISIGVNASGSLAFQYGPMYYTVTPVISLKLE